MVEKLPELSEIKANSTTNRHVSENVLSLETDPLQELF